MIVFVYGTSAEAIKIAPLARRLRDSGIPYEQWLTMFHGDSLFRTIEFLGFTPPTVVIPNGNKGNSIQTPLKTLSWLVAMFWWIFRNRKTLRNRLGDESLIVVHGDTLTTVMGTIFGKILKLPSGHIEAGLRSGNWRHPFPEELDRRIAGKLASIHYVPTLAAAENLKSKQNVVFTHGNTVIDSVLDTEEIALSKADPFGVCLLHRFEFLGNRELVQQTMQEIAQNTPIPVKVYLDDYSGSFLSELISEIGSPNIVAERKLPYGEFIQTLKKAEFVFTDSGGIQAECALLGIPTLIHRKATEQQEGVGENIVLSRWNMQSVRDFFSNYKTQLRPAMKPEISPTGVILDDLVLRGFVKSDK